MVIGLDLRVLTKGTRTGIEEYTINLFSRFFSLRKDIEFKLFYNAWQKAPLAEEWSRQPNVKFYEFNLPNRFVLDPAAKFCKFPKIDKLIGGADIFFAPHFLLAPISKKCRKIITFHDLSFEYFPEFFPWQKRFWHWSLAPKKRVQEADKIIAVSRSTKNDLIDLYSVPTEKIKVIYSGVGEEYKKFSIFPGLAKLVPLSGTNGAGNFSRPRQACPAKRDERGGQFLNIKKYELPEKFILYFGTLEPRKNLTGLIKAYEIFRERTKLNEKYFLVIAGRPGWLFDEILAAAKKSPFSSEIVLTGFVEPKDKVYLYNLASLFIYPSFFEGFGFPPLEAMACGVPTITSFTSSFPEIVGEAALMVDPYNYEEIAWVMEEILTDERLRNNLVLKGFNHAKKFSWDKCARETLDFLIC